MKELTNIFLKIIFNSAMLQKHVIFFFRVSISAGFDVRKLAKKKRILELLGRNNNGISGLFPERESRSQDQCLKTIKLRQIDHVILSEKIKREENHFSLSLALFFFLSLPPLFSRLNQRIIPEITSRSNESLENFIFV